jgi:hypothetical protein
MTSPVLIDGQTLQAKAHRDGSSDSRHPLEAGRRLRDFLEAVKRQGGRPVLTPPGFRFEARDLSDARAVVIPTRTEPPYLPAEIDALERFVREGGGLWVMSNHDPFHRESRSLVERFGMSLEGTFFHSRSGLTEIGPELLDAEHPLLRGPDPPASAVRRIVTNTTDSVAVGSGRTLVRLPSELNDRRPAPLPSGGRAFAAVAQAGSGRVFVMADSGLFGSAGTSYPGYGLWDRGDNARLAENAVWWLLGGGAPGQ